MREHPRVEATRDLLAAYARRSTHFTPPVVDLKITFRGMARAMEQTQATVRLIRERIPPPPEPPADESPRERALRLRQTRNTGPNPFEKRTRT